MIWKRVETVKRRMVLVLFFVVSLSGLFNVVNATDGSFADQFVGSPLLILTAIIIIDIVAFFYHKVRR
jgi:hypothetical protein